MFDILIITYDKGVKYVIFTNVRGGFANLPKILYFYNYIYGIIVKLYSKKRYRLFKPEFGKI